MTNFRIFSLHPDIFTSFVGNSLIARGLANQIIGIETCNWRDNFGIGNYKQVDDKPYGGGSGMVLMAEPIIKALESYNCINTNYLPASELPRVISHQSYLPNNSKFLAQILSGKLITKKVNIMMSPRGFRFNQVTAQWLVTNFEEINILCGRYEGFDARVNENVDLEISIGDFVLNGGEVGAMCVVEAISRLVPGFINKGSSVLHDSFSSGLNSYSEFAFENGSKSFRQQFQNQSINIKSPKILNLFDDNDWIKTVLPFIEHPQYTRSQVWRDLEVPQVLIGGNHSEIQKWRKKWY